jgi:hypothetical protein
MKPSFVIPAVYAGRGERIELNSNDLVIPWPYHSSTWHDSFEVKPIRKGFYEVYSRSQLTTKREVLFETHMVRLAKIEENFLREEHYTGPTPCFSYKGVWHRYMMDQHGGLRSVCGESLYRPTAEMPVREPTCQECREPFWAVLSVLPYWHPVESRKAANKERAKKREWERRPTLWDRLHAQDEPDQPVEDDPVHDFDDPVDQDFEDTPEGREAKLQARIKRARTYETAKEALKKELVAARRKQ